VGEREPHQDVKSIPIPGANMPKKKKSQGAAFWRDQKQKLGLAARKKKMEMFKRLKHFFNRWGKSDRPLAIEEKFEEKKRRQKGKQAAKR